ncbi:MAG: glucose 1-dehydrogenase [Alphaproteobacteria bacterium]|nr:glucose 1-dehydrogenase [Alphaproteobacteria bacterium]
MNKTVLITGASGGIGAATAIEAARKGFDVCIHYHKNEAGAHRVSHEIKKLGQKVFLYQANLVNSAEIIKMFENIDKEVGRLDGLVNNAGITQLRRSIQELTHEDYDALFNTNVHGVIFCTQEAIKRIIKQKGGSIVNVSSQAATFGGNKILFYAMSKGAINTFTVGLARELAPYKIRVNAVSPGVIDTPQHAQAEPIWKEEVTKTIPLGRIGDPSDVANAIAWLLSDESSYITGTIIPVSGGR